LINQKLSLELQKQSHLLELKIANIQKNTISITTKNQAQHLKTLFYINDFGAVIKSADINMKSNSATITVDIEDENLVSSILKNLDKTHNSNKNFKDNTATIAWSLKNE
jgi:hypothetical protein